MNVIGTLTKRICSNDSDIVKAIKIFDPRCQTTFDEEEIIEALELLAQTYNELSFVRLNMLIN